jgi:hypothetical protein
MDPPDFPWHNTHKDQMGPQCFSFGFGGGQCGQFPFPFADGSSDHTTVWGFCCGLLLKMFHDLMFPNKFEPLSHMGFVVEHGSYFIQR